MATSACRRRSGWSGSALPAPRSLAKLTQARVALERQVELMSDGSLERDMIDEISRYQLNMSRTDEIVIMNTYF